MGRQTLLKREKTLKEKVLPFLASLAKGPTAKPKPERTKKVSAADMATKLMKYSGAFLRNPDDWRCNTYNPAKQLNSFLRHVYCLYPVPAFLYRIFTDDKIIKADLDVLVWWFISIGAGRSFRREAKGIFTAAEAHLFLHAPDKNTVYQNAWWAKCKAQGWPDSLIYVFTRRASQFPFRSTVMEAPRERTFWSSVITFFTRYLEEIDADTLTELLDYLGAVGTDYHLEGRTLGSVIRLSNHWHTQFQALHATVDYLKQKWEGMPIKDWESDAYGKTWMVKQLLTGKALAFEAKIQHHCVMSYAQRCAQGSCSIFTLHSIDEKAERKHLTIEVDKDRYIIQVRGKFNRSGTPEELNMVSQWAADNGLRKRSWSW